MRFRSKAQAWLFVVHQAGFTYLNMLSVLYRGVLKERHTRMCGECQSVSEGTRCLDEVFLMSLHGTEKSDDPLECGYSSFDISSLEKTLLLEIASIGSVRPLLGVRL